MELTKLKGLGEKSRDLLNNLNIFSVEDLLMYYPYGYNVYNISDINKANENEQIIIVGKVDSTPIARRFKRNFNSLSFRVFTSNKLINVVIFNRAFMKNNITPGSDITLIGKYNSLKNTFTASNILLSKIEEGSIESKYHLTSGISNKQISKYVDSALKENIALTDYIPEEYNDRYNFINKREAVYYIHKPSNIDEIKKAKLKLIYEELFTFMFKINYLKYVKSKEEGKEPKKDKKEEVDKFIDSLPFSLTTDQIKTVEDIHTDLISDKRMNRLVCGDVGSGKTIVGVIASYECFLSGYQSALMAPTEILATQHYLNIKNLLKDTNMNVELLLGSTKKKDKEEIYRKLENGEIDLIIGTHALISEKVTFKNLGLVITDEQHRFGVNQRNSLRNKGNIPDILYMSATPIPRTYALTIYGDMDISLIKTKPAGRKEINTIIKSDKEIKDVLSLMLEEIKKGHQVYVVSPLIEESEEENTLTTVNELKEKLDIAFNKKVKVEILHGKLSKEDKEKVMDDFKEGKTKVLVSTTVIEVGVDVKNATMMVIFNAERFGLATLHQLRGRIGRNSLESTCILVGKNDNERLKVLEESNDGFYITEKDFEMRREGDLFGTRQSGDMSFKIADIKRDFKVLLKTKEDSEEFLLKNIKNGFKNEEKYYKIIDEMKRLD